MWSRLFEKLSRNNGSWNEMPTRKWFQRLDQIYWQSIISWVWIFYWSIIGRTHIRRRWWNSWRNALLLLHSWKSYFCEAQQNRCRIISQNRRKWLNMTILCWILAIWSIGSFIDTLLHLCIKICWYWRRLYCFFRFR